MHDNTPSGGRGPAMPLPMGMTGRPMTKTTVHHEAQKTVAMGSGASKKRRRKKT